jgi:tRNA(Ile2) C34 agmatinyltransferase TiaS
MPYDRRGCKYYREYKLPPCLFCGNELQMKVAGTKSYPYCPSCKSKGPSADSDIKAIKAYKPFL